jgi:hypothetical protein
MECVEELISQTFSEIDTRGLNARIPEFTTQHLLNMVELNIQASSPLNPEPHEDDEEFCVEPEEHYLDSWARCRMPVMVLPPNPAIQESYEFGGLTRRKSSKRQSPNTTKGSKFQETGTSMNINTWKENAKAFLTSCREEDMPTNVPLKQIVDRPTTGEQKMRILMEQNLLKETKLKQEQKLKLETMEQQRKATKMANSTLTYDYEGKIIEVKPSPASNRVEIFGKQLP